MATPLTSATQALVAVGSITEPTAEAVLDDYGLAFALRTGEDDMHRSSRSHLQQQSGAAQPLAPRRVVPCDCDVEHASGTLHVHYVSLGDDDTSVAVTFRGSHSAQFRPHRMTLLAGGYTGGWGPPQFTLTDDRGTTVSADFSGGGSEDEWRGRLVAGRPLARDTAWIEIAGERLALVDLDHHVDVSVQPLPEEDPGFGHLWRLVTTPHHFHGPWDDVEPAIEALVAAGALSSEDPAIDEIRAVLAAIGDGQVSSAGATRRLPEPWRSMIGRRGRADGPTGTLVIGAVTPPLDGVSIAVGSLASTESGWGVEVEVAPGGIMDMPFAVPSARRRQLAWWATDDRGNRYLGQIGDWGGGEERDYGEIGFWPALDPKATQLDLMPTGDTQRAVVRVPLTWHRAAAGAT